MGEFSTKRLVFNNFTVYILENDYWNSSLIVEMEDYNSEPFKKDVKGQKIYE